MMYNAIIYMRNFLLYFNLISIYIWRCIPQPLEPKAANLILRLVFQYNLNRRSLLITSFGPHFFFATMFESIVFAAFRMHFVALFAMFLLSNKWV